MRAVDVLKRKKLGQELSSEEIRFLIDGLTRGEIPRYQLSAFLMAVYFRGMTDEETAALTEAMLRSGVVLDFSDLHGPKVDKHSTGGVGDKTSLVIAPLAASAGLFVPMITGRGLGHSGGTLDKLQSIPGFDVHLDEHAFRRVVSTVGAAIIGQTKTIAPADRKLYALRDVTSTIESLPLITGSILSKKLAEGISGLVLDVKVGSGAFMKTREEATALARLLLVTAGKMGTRTVALLTDMSQPLGAQVGNASEVEEAIAALKGEGPDDLTRLSLQLTAHMLVVGGLYRTLEEAIRRAEEELRSGRGLEKFLEIVKAQGGNPSVVDGTGLARARSSKAVRAQRDGFVTAIETEGVGTAAMLLGAGRERVEDAIDPGAGIVVHNKIGDEVKRGDPLVTLQYNDGRARVADAERRIVQSYTISEEAPNERPELLIEVLEQNDRERTT